MKKDSQRIQLSDHFTYSKLIRFTLPTIVMMLFSSTYSIVDGLFVSNIAGSDALAAINIVWPAISVVAAIGFMLGIGGNAEVAKTLGEGDNKRACQYFSMIVTVVVVVGAALSAICVIFIEPICYFLGASEKIIGYCVDYGRIMLAGLAINMLQIMFQTFFITAEKPHYGLCFIIAAGLTNIVLDYLFIAVFGWGIAGAATATVCGYLVGGILPVIYFLLPNNSLLRLTRPVIKWRVLEHSAVNGSSEMVSNVAASIVTFLYNYQLMRIAGEDGVAAIAVIFYVMMVFNAIVFGYSFGIAPVIGYHYGAQNHDELKNLFRRCLILIGTVSVIMTAAAELTAGPVTNIFCGGDTKLEEMTTVGFRLYATSFVLCGFNIFGSSFFTALCNGKISAAISFFRTFLMEMGMLLLLPTLIGLTGVWLAVPVTEVVTFGVVILFWATQRKRYHYI